MQLVKSTLIPNDEHCSFITDFLTTEIIRNANPSNYFHLKADSSVLRLNQILVGLVLIKKTGGGRWSTYARVEIKQSSLAFYPHYYWDVPG